MDADDCVRWFVAVDAAGGPRGGVGGGSPCRRLLPWRAISDSETRPVPCACPGGLGAPVVGSRGVGEEGGLGGKYLLVVGGGYGGFTHLGKRQDLEDHRWAATALSLVRV